MRMPPWTSSLMPERSACRYSLDVLAWRPEIPFRVARLSFGVNLYTQNCTRIYYEPYELTGHNTCSSLRRRRRHAAFARSARRGSCGCQTARPIRAAAGEGNKDRVTRSEGGEDGGEREGLSFASGHEREQRRDSIERIAKAGVAAQS